MEVTLEQLSGDPHPVLHALRTREPVAWVPALDGWLVTRRDLALAVMRDAGAFTVADPRFTTARVVGPSMLSLDGAEHDRHRAAFARAWRREPIRRDLGPVTRSEAQRLLTALPEEAELRRGFAGPLAASLMAHALGLDADVGAVLRCYEAIVHGVDEASAGRPVPGAAHEAFAWLDAEIGDALDAPGLSRREAVSNAAVLLFGGIETTEGMIANALWHLLTHPDQLARVREDPTLLANAVEESLRLEPAAARVDRYAARDVSLAGARIARGDLVIVSVSAANRDPEAFADPDRFDVARAEARRHLAFAHGPHVCLGMHLARLEAHAALELVLARDPVLLDRATPPRGLTFRKPAALWARLAPASTPSATSGTPSGASG